MHCPSCDADETECVGQNTRANRYLMLENGEEIDCNGSPFKGNWDRISVSNVLISGEYHDFHREVWRHPDLPSRYWIRRHYWICKKCGCEWECS